MKKIILAMLLLPLLFACQPSKNPLSEKNEGPLVVKEGVWRFRDDSGKKGNLNDYCVTLLCDRYVMVDPNDEKADPIEFRTAEIGGRTYVSIATKPDEEKPAYSWLSFLLLPEPDGSVSLVFFNDLTDASVLDKNGGISLSTADYRAWLEKNGSRIKKFDKDGRPANYLTYRRLSDDEAKAVLENATPKAKKILEELSCGTAPAAKARPSAEK